MFSSNFLLDALLDLGDTTSPTRLDAHLLVLYSLCVASCILLLGIVLSFWRDSQISITPPRTPAIDALLRYFCPPRSVWPTAYLRAARQAESSRSNVIRLGYENVMEDLKQGRIQLRESDMTFDALLDELNADASARRVDEQDGFWTVKLEVR